VKHSELELVVAHIDEPVPGIRSLRLVAHDEGVLPAFIPGSHVVLDCGGHANSYSLTNDGLAPTEYRVSVLHVRNGRGGSRWVHEEVEVGDHISAMPPRSAFAPHSRASKHLMIAGGIGVTPIVSHLRHARRWNHRVQVLYSHREGYGAHVDDLDALAGPNLEIYVDQNQFSARVDEALADQPVGTHLYVCGPGPMMDYVLGAATARGWPPSRLHSERFGVNLDPGEPFEVVLTKTGRILHVPSGNSLLDTLENAGVAVPSMCRQGVCGECRIPVSTGTPLHRDFFLDDAAKAQGTTLMCCVSRAVGPRLEIPL
jgi:ferredoxin-NADP reductase